MITEMIVSSIFLEVVRDWIQIFCAINKFNALKMEQVQ